MKSVKKQILLTLISCVHSVAALQCWTCSDGSCSSQTSVNCSSSQSMCVSSAVSVFLSAGNSSSFSLSKGCASSDQCPSIGVHHFSVKFDPIYHRQNSTCCNSDNCNSANTSLLAPPAGPLQCYSCDPHVYECKAKVSCDSGESCFYSRVPGGDSSRPIHGCVSENMCGSSSSLPFFTSAPVTCCNTSHCNKPGSSLQCMACSDSRCSSQSPVFCPEVSDRCLTVYQDGIGTFKGCAPPSVCSEFVSINIGSGPYIKFASCCDSDFCNAPNPTAPPAGSLQCYGCAPDRNDTVNVTCNIMETCFEGAFASGRHVCGCVSKNLCNNTSLSQEYFGDNSSMSCCITPFCNRPRSDITGPAKGGAVL